MLSSTAVPWVPPHPQKKLVSLFFGLFSLVQAEWCPLVLRPLLLLPKEGIAEGALRSSMLRATIMALTIAVAASLAARDPALGPMLDPAPGPAASETMQSVIDSLLARSHERRSAHKRLLAQQDADKAAPDEAIGQADAEPSSAATGTALPDPVPESSAVAPAAAASEAAAPAAAPTAAQLQAAEAKVARVTEELKRLRAMSPNCADAQPTELAAQPSPEPEPCPDWVGSVREAMRRLDECQAELNDLNRQLDEREQLLTRLRAAPPVDASAAATVNETAPMATPCPSVNETVVTVERPDSTASATPLPFTRPRRITRLLQSPTHHPDRKPAHRPSAPSLRRWSASCTRTARRRRPLRLPPGCPRPTCLRRGLLPTLLQPAPAPPAAPSPRSPSRRRTPARPAP